MEDTPNKEKQMIVTYGNHTFTADDIAVSIDMADAKTPDQTIITTVWEGEFVASVKVAAKALREFFSAVTMRTTYGTDYELVRRKRRLILQKKVKK